MTGRPAVKVALKLFSKLDDRGRYNLLSKLLEGHAVTNTELKWRAELCSALAAAGFYPLEKHT